MQTNTYLSNRLREVFFNGKWIANTNYKEQLNDINWEQATCKIESLNSIAMLTFHVTYYLKGILQVFNGGTLDIKDKFSFDLPEINSKVAWDNLLSDFLKTANNFADKVEQLNEIKFNEVFVEEKYGSYQRNIEAVIEHSYYHLGQICLIKKLIQKGNLISKS